MFYRILQELGSGEFGIVHLGLWLDGSTNPVQVAVKTLNSQCLELYRQSEVFEGGSHYGSV